MRLSRADSVWRSAISTVAILVVTLSSCSKQSPRPAEHASFDTPDAAADALVAALEQGDPAGLRKLLGPETDALISSGDDVADRNARDAFVARFKSAHQWVAGGPDDLVLLVGEDGWPLPIPLIRTEGRWHFDGAAGADELISRRIGANELRVIDVMRGFVAAQSEYASAGHDGRPTGLYARQLRSDPGRRNGLYWEAKEDEPRSPAGPLLAAASAEGYSADGAKRQPYHGYLFRLLFAQGPDAAGGARDYVAEGQLSGGVALLAWPVEYGRSGVMTFMVNQDGIVWQKDLGEETSKVAGEVREFNPDSSWIPIAPEEGLALR
jgi:hypothetical protein